MDLKLPKPLEKCKTWADAAYIQRYKYLKYQEVFRRIFKVPLKNFWPNNLTGFDIIAFDDWANDGDKCLKDVVAKRWGEDASNLITELC